MNDGFNGTSGVHVHMTNSRLTDPEILETRFPVVLEDFHIREGSGGKGRMARRRRHQPHDPLPCKKWTARSSPRIARVRPSAGWRRRPGQKGATKVRNEAVLGRDRGAAALATRLW
jgi:5-oxoprolinase (ATP-hydrolysing)